MPQHRPRSMNAPRSARSARSTIEPLETRTLLSKAVAGVFDVSKVPVFHPTNDNLADVQNGPMANAGSQLAGLYLDYRRAVKNNKAIQTNSLQYRQMLLDEQRVGVTLRTRGELRAFGHDLTDKYGFEAISS